MSGGEELKFDKESLALITKGLNSAIGELKSAGGGATGSLQGSGFGEMSMSKMEAGDAGLADDFESFCERWEWGVRALVQDANALAAKLGLAAGMVHEEDKYWEGAFKVGVNSLIGNPHATEEEVAKQSWGETFTPGFLDPDYSPESFQQAQQEIGQTWKDTGRSLTEDGIGGLQNDVVMDAYGIPEEAREQARDDAFGPSAEERAQQQQSGSGDEG
ncbi:hypothetical protein [Streptomyces albidus (ex Kaewkla and Franco 2022)]|uniref:hypothetical protein n=1 Tax=Streptomyces albidus (ex Kaewkla and Franco 2022) TaxID=722709 RepID=UPI0015EF89C5|nr:hypothetical protein [Streptomyces albidus (ex Kaewkla and Franco 2022)]